MKGIIATGILTVDIHPDPEKERAYIGAVNMTRMVIGINDPAGARLITTTMTTPISGGIVGYQVEMTMRASKQS